MQGWATAAFLYYLGLKLLSHPIIITKNKYIIIIINKPQQPPKITLNPVWPFS